MGIQSWGTAVSCQLYSSSSPPQYETKEEAATNSRQLKTILENVGTEKQEAERNNGTVPRECLFKESLS